jgi:hypothetical protein
MGGSSRRGGVEAEGNNVSWGPWIDAVNRIVPCNSKLPLITQTLLQRQKPQICAAGSSLRWQPLLYIALIFNYHWQNRCSFCNL